MATHQIFRHVIMALTLLCSFLLAGEIPKSAQDEARPKLLIQSGHHNGVNDVSYSPDGTLIATAGGDKKIKLWDAKSRKLLNDLEGHSGSVSAINFSPDSKLLASCGDNNEAFIWDVQTGRLLQSLRGHGSGVNSIAFSPDGKTLATAGGHYEDVSDNTIRIWDVQSGRQIGLLKGHSSGVRYADFALSGRALISVGMDKTIKIWSVPNGQLVNSINTPDYVDDLRVLSDGQSFATVSNKVATLWDVQGHPLRTLNLPGPANVIAFSKDSTTFAFNCANENCVEIRAFPSGQIISKLEGVVPEQSETEYPRDKVRALSFSPDGKTLITAAFDSAKLWSRDNGKLLGTLATSIESGGKLAVSPDGKIIAVGSGGKVVFWDTQSGTPLRILQGHTDAVRDLAFSRDSTVLATVSSAEGIKVWSTASGQLLWSFRGTNDDLRCVRFSPDGRFVATAGKNILVKLLNAQSGHLIRTLVVPNIASTVSPVTFLKANFVEPMSGPAYVLSVAFSPDSSLVAAADEYLPLNIWDTSSGQHLRTLGDPQQSVNSIIFSVDGKVLLAGNQENSVRFWSVANGKLLKPINDGASVRSVAIDRSGAFLASSNSDGIVSLRRSSDGSLIREFKGHTSAVDTVAFSSDGKTLISGGDDGSTNLWSAGDGRLLLTLITFTDGNWLTLTSEGYYDGSAGASQYITWRSGDRVYGAAQFQRQLNKPEIVRARLSSAVAPVVAVAATSPPPDPTPEPVDSETTVNDRLRRQAPSKKFYALVIGNNNYQFVKSLKTAVKDAEDVAKMLSEDFGFQTKLIRNGTRQQIMGEINRYKHDLDADSNLLIYYAGHGYLDNRVKEAYWWPVNAAPQDPTEWISADDITTSLKGMEARHVLVVSDSCYSGAIHRSEIVGTYKLPERERYLRKIMSGTSRTLIASGGDEPVDDDSSGNGHSVFANAFLNGLRKFETDIFTAEELFYEYIRIPVSGKSGQTPEFDPLYNSGHDSGVFVFIRKRSQ